MTWIDDRIQQYYAWMKDNTIVHEDNGTGWCSVSTPFIGIFNDHIQIFIKKEGEKTFPQMKNAFISAICEISDLEKMAKHTVASVFKEDVDTSLKNKM